MDILDDDTKMKVWDILETDTPVVTLCKCNPMFTVAVHLTGDIIMTNDSVLATAHIFDADMIPSTFCGKSIHSSKCDCEPRDSFPVRFPMWQWDLMQREYQSLVLVGAIWSDDVVDMSMPFSAVLPAPWKDAFHFTMDHSVACFEMFAGGFGGWSHAIRALSRQKISIFSSCALDRDDMCCKAFVQSHAYDITTSNGADGVEKINDCENRGVNPKVFFHSSMEDLWWLTLLKRERIDMWCMSPPCPPWSRVDLSAGLCRIDGRNLVVSLMLVALARPRVVALENVSSLITHKHWAIIKDLFWFIGYQIRWSKTLDLADILPQRRERLLLIATDMKRTDSMPFVCQMWPTIDKHTFRTYGALIDIAANERWSPNARLTHEELQMYLDPANLPKDAKVSGHAKRSSRDVVKYRLRTVDDKAACILTSYGFPTHLHGALIQRGGIYGSLILEGGTPRKMTIPELLILMGLVSETWMPLDVIQATQLIGNAISIPHALIAILNGMMFIEATHLDIPIQEVFAAIVGDPIRARNISFRFEMDGVWIGRSENDETEISSTQPMIQLSHLIVQSPTESFAMLCQEGIPIKQVLKVLTGPSMPLHVDLELSQDPKIKMPVSEQMNMDGMDLKIFINVPCRFMMDEVNFASFQSSFIVILTEQLPIIISRTNKFMIQDIHVVLATAGINSSEDWSFVGVAHNPFSMDEICPDALFVIRPKMEVTIQQLDLVKDNVIVSEQCIVWKSTMDTIVEVFGTLKKVGVVDVLSCLGWHFTMTIPYIGSNREVTMFFTIKPGHLSSTFSTAKSMCIMMTFLMTLPSSRPFTNEVIFIRLKIWNSIVWQGFVHKEVTGSVFLQAWNHASNVFQTPMEMRLITKGKQMNPEWEIGHYIKDEQNLTIHMVQGLIGGGPKQSDTRDHAHIPLSIDDSSMDEAESDPLQVERESLDQAVTLLINDMFHCFSNLGVLDLLQFDNIQFVADGIRLCASGTAAQVLRIMSTFHHTGIEDTLHKIGWSMVLEMTMVNPVKLTCLSFLHQEFGQVHWH